MGAIHLEVWDMTGSRRQSVELPDDEPIGRILIVLARRMGLPTQGPDGLPISYKFHHKGTGTQLLDNQTLAQASVHEGEVLRIQAEITAGADISAIKIDADETHDRRFSRFELIEWWDQTRLKAAHVLVVGAGALGNEIIKNLALLGIGNIVLVDMDRIEASNLSRSILFRETDEGLPKAEVAAKRAREIYPDLHIQPICGNIVYDVGLGLYRWADVVIAGLDNRLARLTINRSCWKVGTAWIDGAIEALSGVARVFLPPEGICYECTMSENDWKIINHRRSCKLLNRQEMEAGKVPTTPTSASVIGGIQCQEALKLLHKRETLNGKGFFFEGLTHNSYVVSYQKNPECQSHAPFPPIYEVERSVVDTTAADILVFARRVLDAQSVHLIFNFEVVTFNPCDRCGHDHKLFRPLEAFTEADAKCPSCGEARVPIAIHQLNGDESYSNLTLSELGLPPWEIIVARSKDRAIAMEFVADRQQLLGPLAGD